MLKKSITYTDYNGTERTEDFYFNLTKMELTKLSVNTPGGFTEYVKRITDSQDAKEILDTFYDIIKMAYGEKSDDGRHFNKSEEISEGFINSPAYDVLCEDFFFSGDADEGAKKCAFFIRSILPQEFRGDSPALKSV